MDKIAELLKKNKEFSLRAEGPSMLPLLQANDIIFCRKTAFKNIKVNDIVIVKKNKFFLTHRVIYKTHQYLVAKGDNNLLSDGKIFPQHIIARIYQVKRNGNIFYPSDFYLLQSKIYFREILKTKKALEREKIDFVFLKGLPLHLCFERSFPQRIYNDCDILIRKNYYQKAVKVLTDLGYKKSDTSLSKAQEHLKDKEIEVTYYKFINGFPVVFDLHLEVVFLMTQLGKLNNLYPQQLVDNLTNEFLEEKKVVKVQSEKFPILSSENLIIYLALHFFHHNHKGIFRLEFLHKVIKKSDLSKFTESIIYKIQFYKLQNFVYPSFLLIKKYYKTNLPMSFFKQIKAIINRQNYIYHHIKDLDIFTNESRTQAGINRFKNLFFLSQNKLIMKLFIFANPQVIHALYFVLKKRAFGKNT